MILLRHALLLRNGPSCTSAPHSTLIYTPGYTRSLPFTHFSYSLQLAFANIESARVCFARLYGRRLQLERLEMNFSLKLCSPADFSLDSRCRFGAAGALGTSLWSVRRANEIHQMAALTENGLFDTMHGPRRKSSARQKPRASRRSTGELLLAWVGDGTYVGSALAVEARLLLALDRHPNIISLTAFVGDGRPMMITEMPDGGTLRSFLHTHGGSVSTKALRVACENIASAMAYVESLAIVHRALCLDAVAVFGHLQHAKLMGFGETALGELHSS